MKRTNWFLLTVILLMIGCQNSKFERDFECDTPLQFTNTKTYTDVLKHFEVDIPKKWKTKLYYDEYQSKLYTADTTKELTSSYMIDITWHQGELVLDKDFEVKLAESARREHQLIPVKNGQGEFLEHPSFYLIATGKMNDLNWHYLQVYVKTGVDEYYTLTSKIYGNEFVTERICSSFAIFKEIEFLQSK